MQRIRLVLIIAPFLFFSWGCSPNPENWESGVPENTPIIYTFDSETRLKDFPSVALTNFIDDITPSRAQLAASLDENELEPIFLESLLLYPSSSTEWQPVFLASAGKNRAEALADRFIMPNTVNSFSFEGETIYLLFLGESVLFAAQIGKWLVISEASIAVERSLAAFLNKAPALDFSKRTEHGQLQVNVPHLNQWLQHFSLPIYRPAYWNSLSGSDLATFSADLQSVSPNLTLEMRGFIPVDRLQSSTLLRSVSYKNSAGYMDRFISSNAAAFAELRLPAASAPPSNYDPDFSLDSLLINSPQLYTEIAQTLHPDFAFESFAESGLSSTGEYVFLRRLSSPTAFSSKMNELAEKGFLISSDDVWQASGSVFAGLLGSEMCTFTDFYISLVQNVLIISQRKGLAESIRADIERRRVLLYDEVYSDFKKNIPAENSAYVWMSSKELQKFLRTFVAPQNYLSAFYSRFDFAVLSFRYDDTRSGIDVKLNTFSKQRDSAPYEEQWVFPLPRTEITGKPVLADIAGSDRDELIFAAETGTVYVSAMDGTLVLQMSTFGSKPVGSPLVYDWYSNNQKVILIGAGNQIFAWNENGELLPKFPFSLNAEISAPIVIRDVNRSGTPEIVVPTIDGNVHILNGRGESLPGWPQKTNAAIVNELIFATINNQFSIWATAENMVHAWGANGIPRNGFPVFSPVKISGKLKTRNNHLLLPGGDGSIYTVGTSAFFPDTLASVVSADSLVIQQFKLSDSPIISIESHSNVLLKDTTAFYRDDILLASTLNGSIFGYNAQGNLRFFYNMGQSIDERFAPTLSDINSDGRQEVIAVSQFGRLYAWEILTSERIYSIPASALSFPIITDLNRDGIAELTAKTAEGIRNWEIRKQE